MLSAKTDLWKCFTDILHGKTSVLSYHIISYHIISYIYRQYLMFAYFSFHYMRFEAPNLRLLNAIPYSTPCNICREFVYLFTNKKYLIICYNEKIRTTSNIHYNGLLQNYNRKRQVCDVVTLLKY